MIKPKALKLGDTVGIVAPSSPVSENDVNLAKHQLENLGFNVKLAPSCFAKYGHLAGEPELRANDLNNMFSDKKIDGIICLRGGYGASRLLDKVDFQLIRKNPKVFVGYSDITVLHIAMNQISNLVTFHGPMAASDIASGLDKFSKKEFLRAIIDKRPMDNICNPPGIGVERIVGGKATGAIIGGNLALITAAMGTPYEIDTKGKILFLEEIGETPEKVERMLAQLALAGKLEEANGIVLGDWNDCEAENPKKSLSLMNVFKDVISPYKKPTIYNLKAGHCTPKVTLPFGLSTYIDADKGEIIVKESGTI